MKGLLSYKNKNRLLLVTSILLLYLSYTMAINETIAMHKTVNTMQEQASLASDIPARLKVLETSLKEVERNPGKQLKDTSSSVQQTLLDYITWYSQEHNIVLREFPKTIRANQQDIQVETNVFTAEADFITLLKLIYDMEKHQFMGKVSSVQFQSKQDYKTKAIALTSTIYLQYVRKKTNEK